MPLALEIPYGYCECGCGERTSIATKTDRKNGSVKGEPRRFIRWHRPRTVSGEGSNPGGLCQCGCGEPAPLAPDSNRPKGEVKGKPRRFIQRHHPPHKPGNQPNWITDENGCFVWQGTKVRGGYGMVRVGGRAGKNLLAHRFYFQCAKGPIPPGLHLHHICANPACVNPDHLEAVSARDHSARHREAA